jgi:glutamate synthase domain-containing protein 3
MSGGVAYVFDEDGQFARRCNTSMVALEKVLPRAEQAGPDVGWHQQLADEVGSVREIVTRILRSFADQGLVRLSRGSVEVLDAGGLRRVAEGI